MNKFLFPPKKKTFNITRSLICLIIYSIHNIQWIRNYIWKYVVSFMSRKAFMQLRIDRSPWINIFQINTNNIGIWHLNGTTSNVYEQFLNLLEITLLVQCVFSSFFEKIFILLFEFIQYHYTHTNQLGVFFCCCLFFILFCVLVYHVRLFAVKLSSKVFR